MKVLALRKFTPLTSKVTPGLCTAMVVVYMSTPDTDKDMRKKVIELFVEWPFLVKVSLIDKTSQELPQLVYALFREFVAEKIDV